MINEMKGDWMNVTFAKTTNTDKSFSDNFFLLLCVILGFEVNGAICIKIMIDSKSKYVL